MSKRKLPDIETLKHLYLDKKKTLAEICIMFDCSTRSRSNISKMLRDNGVEIRQDKGENHHAWKGGRILKGDGYIGIWSPSHERADKQGYVYEHTLVVEKEMGRLPNSNEVVHHINLDKTDNRTENLWVCGNKEHLVCHRSIEKLIKPLLESGVIYFCDGEYKICK